MKRTTTALIFSTMAIMSLTNCQNKKAKDGTIDNSQAMEQANDQPNVSQKKADLKTTKSFNSYTFAENLKNDNFFETDNVDKIIELNDVGITSYFVSGDEVTLRGIFYDKDKNMAIPVFTNNPPGRAFETKYFDKLEMKYDEKYKHYYSASLRITLKDPKVVKKLKMYVSSEPFRNYEYQVDKGGIEPEYRDGFIDLVNVTGLFRGTGTMSNYTETVYEIVDAEIRN